MVTTDLGNKFATLDRELPVEAVRRTKRFEDRNAIAVVRGPTRRCTARPSTWRSPTNAARSFNPGGRGLHDRPQHGGPGDPAPQGSGNAAGRLTRRGRPAAVRQLDDFLAPPRLFFPEKELSSQFRRSLRNA